jgi:hypothetical protein
VQVNNCLVHLVHNSLKQGHALLTLLFCFALGYALRKVQEHKQGSDSKGAYWLWSMLKLTYEMKT